MLLRWSGLESGKASGGFPWCVGIMMLNTKKTEKSEAADYTWSSSKAVSALACPKNPVTPVTTVAGGGSLSLEVPLLSQFLPCLYPCCDLSQRMVLLG